MRPGFGLDGSRAPRRRSANAGVSLVELLVSMAVLALGATLSIRVLTLSGRGVEEAELTLRATILIGEASAAPAEAWAEGLERVAGPGRLVLDVGPDGIPAVRYDPPVSASGTPARARGGFFGAHYWDLRRPP